MDWNSNTANYIEPKYKYDSKNGLCVNEEMMRDFEDDGFVLIRGVLDQEELNKLNEALEHDEGLNKYAYDVNDGDSVVRMCLWNHPGNDITGMLGRSEKIAGTCEQLLKGEVYHYHTKVMMKNAHTGGRFVWHQDYGYWYNFGCLFPDMITVFIAVDKSDRTNGGLQVIKGSHKCGRIDHGFSGTQQGADLKRVAAIQEKLETVCVEMKPGDALYFHCNLLHKSDPNNSEFRRWAFLSAYNKRTNSPKEPHNHATYTPLQKVPDSAIRSCSTITDLSGKDFYYLKKDFVHLKGDKK